MPLTLLDIARLSGSDATVGLIEQITTFAPEMNVLPIRRKWGTSYKISRRTGNPSAGFRNANEGIATGKSTFEQIEVPMFFFDCQLQVDEAIVKASGETPGDVLATEAAGQVRGATIALGDQIYRGTTANNKGFAGLRAQVASTMVVDATGSGTTNTVWFARCADDGLHVPMGNGGSIALGQWMRQRITDTNGNPYMAWVNNMSFYIGLALAHTQCIGAVKNVTSAQPFTDARAADLYAKFPIGLKPTHCFMSRDALSWLQKSRSAVGNQKSNASGDAFAPLPESTMGVPIVPTDSIATEAAW